jgi:hypothetical protein
MIGGRGVFLLLGLAACSSTPAGSAVEFPDGSPAIGFDDLRYSVALHRVLVPAGRSGRLNLVDPDTLAVTSIAGFSTKAEYSGDHDDGPTSVEEALGRLYVTDRTSRSWSPSILPAARCWARSGCLQGPIMCGSLPLPTNFG